MLLPGVHELRGECRFGHVGLPLMSGDDVAISVRVTASCDFIHATLCGQCEPKRKRAPRGNPRRAFGSGVYSILRVYL